MAEAERTFATNIVDVVDELVREHGAAGAEAELQEEYGSDPELYDRQQEALAYLRYTYEGEL